MITLRFAPKLEQELINTARNMGLSKSDRYHEAAVAAGK